MVRRRLETILPSLYSASRFAPSTLKAKDEYSKDDRRLKFSYRASWVSSALARPSAPDKAIRNSEII